MMYLLVTLLAVPCLGFVAPRASATTTSQNAWVTIDYEGHASTVTPTVDGTSTVSAPPSSLTSTSEYVLSINGHKKTTTAAPPFATASGTTGAFMLCESQDYASLTNTGPFCQPQTGSQLTPNSTYYITWDPAYFAALGLQAVELEAQNTFTGKGFATGSIDASSGVYAWAIGDRYLEEQGSVDAANISLYLAFNRSSLSAAGGKRLVRLKGPNVIVTNSPATVQHHSVPVAAIVAPVVVGAVVLATIAFCAWSYRHYGHLPCIGGIVSKRTSSFSAKGYSVSERYGQPTGSFGVTGQPVAPIRTTSGNVFRDELKRQEEQM